MSERPFSIHDLDTRPIVISRSQAKDFKTYQRLKNEAVRRGMVLQIIDDAAYNGLMDDRPAKHEPVTRLPEESRELPETVHTDESGRKHLMISRTDAKDHKRYLAAKARATELDFGLMIGQQQ